MPGSAWSSAAADAPGYQYEQYAPGAPARQYAIPDQYASGSQYASGGQYAPDAPSPASTTSTPRAASTLLGSRPASTTPACRPGVPRAPLLRAARSTWTCTGSAEWTRPWAEPA